MTWKTANISLEEINAIFGDEVVVDITHATAEEKRKLDEVIEEKAAEIVTSEHVEEAWWKGMRRIIIKTRLRRTRDAYISHVN